MVALYSAGLASKRRSGCARGGNWVRKWLGVRKFGSLVHPGEAGTLQAMGALILVVDDSASIRGQIRGVLQDVEGFDQFIEAVDGLQAFKLMLDRHPDLVVCDLIMPVFDGLKFLALRATRPELVNIPVIMLTAEGDADRKVEVLD